MGTIQSLLRQLAVILSPLERDLTKDRAGAFFAQLGLHLSSAQEETLSNSLSNIRTGLSSLFQLIQEIEQAVAADDTGAIIEKTALAIAELAKVIQSLPGMVSAINSLGVSAPPDVINSIPERIFSYLLSRYSERANGLNEVLEFTGLLERTDYNLESTDPNLPFYTVDEFHFNRFADWITNPGGQLTTLYDWNSGGFDGLRLFSVLERILGQSGLPVFLDTSASMPRLEILFLEMEADSAGMGKLIITLNSRLDSRALEFDFGDGNLVLTLNLNALPGMAIHLAPDSIQFIPPDTSSLSGSIGFEYTHGQAEPAAPIVFFSIDGGSVLQVQQINAHVETAIQWNGSHAEADFEIGGGLSGGKLKIGTEESDGFLGTILSGINIENNFDLGFSYSLAQGLHFHGSATLEIQLASHISLGPIELSALTVSLGFDEGTFPLALSSDIKALLGPLTAVVEGLGFQVVLELVGDEDGNLGPINLKPGFKPPNGVGLALDAGTVSGGGYLYFDFDKEEYAGVLELDLSGIVRVTAVGLITTRMPDGSKGFSLLLIITAEFGSPLQLGLGFTLSGVGGLLGLNRTMRLEEIAKGIRDGGINSIMFPQNVVANAPKIISDLKNYFPVEEGTFLIGPMVKIGWGTPNLVTVSLGVIIEIPGNIAILGVLKVALPDEDAALIVIQVNFMGAIEFDKERLWFFASLYESRVLFITLEGDMGLLVGWGEDANFVVSVGGFHPAFNPPALPFGEIRRIKVSILNTDYARIIVQGYFAVTSNSVQFGASVEIFFGIDAFNIDGHLAFDALFRFSPFYFIISISASLSVKVFGIGLFSISMRGSLEGPTPWHVEGEGSISLLFFDISVDFSHTWGEEEDTALPPIAVMPIIEAEYQKLENWRAVLNNQNSVSVTLRSFEQGSVDLILHPVGSLRVSQRAVPLGVTIDKLGNQAPNDANRFELSVETAGIGEKGKINESFARGQFFSEADNKLLDAPSFEPMPGGVELSVEGESLRAPQAVKRVVRYEKIIIDTHYKRFVSHFYAVVGGLFAVFLKANAMTLSTKSWQTKKQMQPFDDKVSITAANYGVAKVENNTAYADNTVSFASYTAAQEYLSQQTKHNPNLKKQLHVIPSVEIQKAA